MPQKYIILSIVSTICVILDQITKQMALPLKNQLDVKIIPGLFSFKYAENHGGAFSTFADFADPWRTIFFITVSLLAFVFIFVFFRKVKNNQYLLVFAFSVILGGALGNFIDRIAYNYVIDFALLYYKNFYWPVFNVADVFIVMGVVMLAIEMLFGKSEFSLFQQDESKPSTTLK